MHISWKPWRDAAIVSASRPPGRFSFTRRFEMKPTKSSRVPLTAFHFLLNGNFTMEKIVLLFEKRDRLWHHYLTILKYPNFTPRTVKRPYHSSQPSAACCWEACAAARSGLIHSSAVIIIIFCTSNLLTLIKNYLHLPSIILSILYCLSSIVSSVRKPSVYCFIDPLWTKGCLLSDLLNSERRESEWTRRRVVPAPRSACSHILLHRNY